jgi:hypothetical protein
MRTIQDGRNARIQSPVIEVAVGVFANLVVVGLFAYYPARWFGLW